MDVGVEEVVYVTIPRGQSQSMEATVDIDEIIYAPLGNRQIMGVVNVTLDEETVFQGDIIAMQEVERGGIIKRFIDWLTLFVSNLFG